MSSMDTLAIRHVTAYTPDAVVPDGTVHLANGQIVAIERGGGAWEGEAEIEGRGLQLIPGLIDLQCNGLAGHDVLDADPRVIQALADILPTYGCTAVLPTLVTAPFGVLQRGLAAIAEVAQQPRGGAAVLGAHMEGPWLSREYHGAHRIDLVRPFDPEELRQLLAAARGTLRLVTLAPEAPGNESAVTALAATGALVSLGHSAASYEQALAAIAQGARMATHLFNAMIPLSHRAPGLPGAALDLPVLTPGLIPDGHHVHPAVIRLIARTRGIHGLVVVTDSVPAAALPPGTFPWQGRLVRWDGEVVRLVADGGMAGSGLTPIQALRRYMHFTGLSLADALPAMTSTPARLLGEQGIRGSIVPGARADLVLLTDSMEVHTTLIGGAIAYAASSS